MKSLVVSQVLGPCTNAGVGNSSWTGRRNGSGMNMSRNKAGWIPPITTITVQVTMIDGGLLGERSLKIGSYPIFVVTAL